MSLTRESTAQDLFNLIEAERQQLNIDPNNQGYRDLIEFYTEFARYGDNDNAYDAMNNIIILSTPSPFNNKSLLHFFTNSSAGREILFHCKEIQSLIDPSVMQGQKYSQPPENSFFKVDSNERTRVVEALLDNERLFATLSVKVQDLARITFHLTHKGQIRDENLKHLMKIYRIDHTQLNTPECANRTIYFHTAFLNICEQIANHRIHSSYSFLELINLQFTVNDVKGFTLLHCLFNHSLTAKYLCDRPNYVNAIKAETFNCRLLGGTYQDSSPLSNMISWGPTASIYADTLHLLEITDSMNLNIPIAAYPYNGTSAGLKLSILSYEPFDRAFKKSPSLGLKFTCILLLECLTRKECFPTIDLSFKQFGHIHENPFINPITTIEALKDESVQLLRNRVASSILPRNLSLLSVIFQEIKIMMDEGASLAEFLNRKTITLNGQLVSIATGIASCAEITLVLAKIPNLATLLDKESINGSSNSSQEDARTSVITELALVCPELIDDAMLEILENNCFNHTGGLNISDEVTVPHGVLINLAQTEEGRRRIITSKKLVEMIDVQAFLFKSNPTENSAFDYFIDSDDGLQLFTQHGDFCDKLPNEFEDTFDKKLAERFERTQLIFHKSNNYMKNGEFFKNIDEIIEQANACIYTNPESNYWAENLLIICRSIKASPHLANKSLAELLNLGFTIHNQRNHSLLLCIAALPTLRLVLNESEIIKSITVEAFNRRLTEGKYHGLSAFTAMFFELSDLEDVHMLPEDLIKLVISDNLNSPIEFAPFSGSTPAEYLVKSSSGHQLFKTCPALALQLNAFDWCTLNTPETDKGAPIVFAPRASLSELEWFIRTDIKINTLPDFKSYCVVLLKTIIVAKLLPEERNMLPLLLELIQLIQINSLQAEDSAELLTDLLNNNIPPTSFNPNPKNITFTFTLSSLPFTAGIISKITNITMRIKEKTLNTPIGPGRNERDKTVLTNLCTYNQEMFNDKQLVKKIDKKRFNTISGYEYNHATYGIGKNYYGAILALATKPRGRRVLIKNPNLVALINTEIFCFHLSSISKQKEQDIYEYFLEDKEYESGLALFVQHQSFAKALPEFIRKKIHDKLKADGLAEIPGLYQAPNIGKSETKNSSKKGGQRKQTHRDYSTPTPANIPSLASNASLQSKQRMDSSMINEALKLLPALFFGLSIPTPYVEKETQQIVFILPSFNVDWEYEFKTNVKTPCRLDQKTLQALILNTITKDDNCEAQIFENEKNVIVKITVNRVASLRNENIFANIPARLKRTCLVLQNEVASTNNNIAAPPLEDAYIAVPEANPAFEDANVIEPQANPIMEDTNKAAPEANSGFEDDNAVEPQANPIMEDTNNATQEVTPLPGLVAVPMPIERKPVNTPIFLDEVNTCYLNTIVAALETTKDKLNSPDGDAVSLETSNDKHNNVEYYNENYQLFFSQFITTLEHFEASIDIHFDEFNEAFNRLPMEQFCECATPIIEHLAQKLKNIFLRGWPQLFAPNTPKCLFLNKSDIEQIKLLIVEASEKAHNYLNPDEHRYDC